MSPRALSGGAGTRRPGGRWLETVLALLCWGLGMAVPARAELTTVPQVDLSRYMGRWYEIARFPNRFQKGCSKVMATYALAAEGEIDVLNTCVSSVDGEVREAKGVGRVVDKATGSKLEVNFVPGFIRWTGVGWGKYWILELASDYSHAVVSEPGREYLWILARQPSLSKATYDAILQRLAQQGFDVSRLIPGQ